MPYAKQDNRTLEQKIAQGANVGSNRNFNSEHTTATSGTFCQSCGAWRGELGLEPTFRLFIAHLIDIFRAVKRVLKPTGTCWVNLGDSYASYKDCKSVSQTLAKGTGNEQAHVIPKGLSVTRNPRMLREQGMPNKSLMNIPARFAIAMTDELQMIQRNEIIWHKPACMPSSATDRFTVDFEPIYFFAKNPKYKFNQQLEESASDWTKKGGSIINATGYQDGAYGKRVSTGVVADGETRNKRTTWRIPFEPQKEKHYASYPTKLVEPMILAGTDEGDTVLDPFNGTGTTGIVALRNRREYIGIELQPEYVEIANRRLATVDAKLFT